MIKITILSKKTIIVNFIIQKLKSKHTSPQKIYKLSKTNKFFSRFEGTRGGKKYIYFAPQFIQGARLSLFRTLE